MPIYKKIAEPENFVASNIKLLLYVNKLQAKELGHYIGESSSNISSWVTQRAMPSITKIQKICLFFNVPLDDFVTKDLQDSVNKYKIAG
ncbi:helix-turn-helix domain-containing protein [Flagellimonas marina]|uniref:Helix-turn-helix domain-containing protein n=1 Tax=Flagellimonas marina TaxID=1775168 RepID=A0ABV8PGE4_9FLAO